MMIPLETRIELMSPYGLTHLVETKMEMESRIHLMIVRLYTGIHTLIEMDVQIRMVMAIQMHTTHSIGMILNGMIMMVMVMEIIHPAFGQTPACMTRETRGETAMAVLT